MKILIVDDESRAINRLSKLSHSILGERISTIQTAAGIESARSILSESKVDLLLLDLNLNGQNGFDILSSFLAEPFYTIVVSAYHEKALEAFEYGVLDFVPKPVEYERLRKAFSRIENKGIVNQNPPRRIAVKKLGGIELVPVDSISYFNGADDYSEIHLTDGKILLYEKTLDAIETIHSPEFIRIHRSYVVKFKAIEELLIGKGSRYSVRLNSGEQLPVGRSRLSEIKTRFDR